MAHKLRTPGTWRQGTEQTFAAARCALRSRIDGPSAWLAPALALALLWSAPARAVPTTVAIEGALMSTAGGPASDGKYPVTFALYKTATGGLPVWTEPVAGVDVAGGHFAFVLGEKSALLPTLVAGAEPLWLEVKVEPEPALPRAALRSVAFALRAGAAEALDCSGCVAAGHLDPAVLQPYAKQASLAKVALSGAFADLSGGPDLSAYVKATALAKVAQSGAWADLSGVPKLADVATTGAYADLAGLPTLTKVANTGAYADLQGLPVLAKLGTACGSGLVVRGLKADGSLDCTSAAVSAADLPPDGLDKVSNGLLTNQFTEVAVSAAAPIDIPDNLPAGTSDAIEVPDLGLAQSLTVHIELSNSDTSKLRVTLFDPTGASYKLWDQGAPGTSLKLTFPTEAKPVSGDLSTWIGKNPKGIWSINVADLAGVGGKDGKLSAWSVGVQTLSSKRVAATGTFIAQKGLLLSPSDAPPVVCDASQLGYLYVNGKDKTLSICNGKDWFPMALVVYGSQATPALHCKDLKAKQPAAQDGLYWIDPDAGDPANAFQAYCDMSSTGGGWTLVARMTNGCMTDSTGAAGKLQSPDQVSCAKLSDAAINLLRTASGSDGVFWGWHDGSVYPVPSSGRYLKITNGNFNASDSQPGLTQQCSCQPGGPWSGDYGAHGTMAGVYNHSAGGWQCVTAGQTGCDNTTVYPQALFLYQHILHQAGTFPSNSHGVPGGANGWLFLR